MATIEKLTAMVAAQELSQDTFDCLSALHKQDIADAKDSIELLTITVTGGITLSRTTSKSELSAISRVLNIPELRAKILQELSAKELLLRVQLVCRGFRDSVQSTSLDRSLYRTPHVTFGQIPTRVPFELGGIRNARVAEDCIVTVPSKITRISKECEYLRNTFVTQPPFSHLRLAHSYRVGQPIPLPLQNYFIIAEGGIKYSHIFDEVEKMEKEGLVKLFKDHAVLPQSDKMVWQILGWPWESVLYIQGKVRRPTDKIMY